MKSLTQASTLRCLWPAAARLGEGPLWSEREHALYWVDILSGALHCYAPETNGRRTWRLPGTVSAVLEREHSTTMLLAMRNECAVFDRSSDSLTPLIAPEPERSYNRLNDAKCDALGRLWVGSMDFDGRQPTGALYRWDGDRCSRQLDGYAVTNGPAWSPDGRTLYFSDSVGGRVLAFDFQMTAGTLGQPRVWKQFTAEEGCPDGLTTDSSGNLWIAHWGGGRVTCFDKDGEILTVIPLPVSQVTSCAFGGDNFRTLFITSARDALSLEQLEREPLAGGLFAIDVTTPGLPANRFSG